MAKRPRVLIVEDEEVQAMSMELLLRTWGYETLESAGTGLEAVERAELEKPDIVLMDINIQGEMDGIEAARLIIGRFGLPVVLITGYDDLSLREKAMKIKPAGYFIKPIELESLKTLMASLPHV